FFSSRRRHTRSTRDWSSDVCSSDLSVPGDCFCMEVIVHRLKKSMLRQSAIGDQLFHVARAHVLAKLTSSRSKGASYAPLLLRLRSEERRVGKAWRFQVWTVR